MMHSRLRTYLLMAFKLYDLAAMSSACGISMVLVPYQQQGMLLGEFLKLRLYVHNFVLVLLLIFLWHVIFTSLDLYESKRLSPSLFAEVPDVLKATSLGTLAILFIGIIFSIDIVTLPFLTTFWILSSAICVASRLVLRYALQQARRMGRNLRHVLIVGTNTRAIDIARTIESRTELGYRLVGFVDEHWHASEPGPRNDYCMVADLSGLQAFLQDQVVDEVIMCVPIKSFYEKASRIIAQCDEHGIAVRFVSDIFTPAQRRALIDQIDDHRFMTVSTAPDHEGLVVKYLVDYIIALALLACLAPLFLVVCVLIKATSPGPVFFVQDRVGLNKRRFRLYKFRTMIVDAEQKLADLEHLNEASGPAFKITRDPRVTPIGRLLRKTSIDELPQLLNILKGEMSLVGPRPLPVRDYIGFSQDCHRRRLSVRPGITGLWQVGGRSSMSFDKWMELDLQYIDQWSLWLDLKILFMTVPAVVKGTGAS